MKKQTLQHSGKYIGMLIAECICALLIIIGIPALIMFIGVAYF